VLDDLPEREPLAPRIEPLRAKQLAFGYTQEDLRLIIAPMATQGEEPVASMGNDAALAVLSDRQPPLFSYFKQLFAQVTNPPVDSIRESVVMSLTTGVGGEGNLLEETPEHAHQLILQQPILRNKHLEKLRRVSHEVFAARTLDTTWPVDDGVEGMERRLDLLCGEAEKSVAAGANIIILSDRNLGSERAPIPSLLAVAARPPAPRPRGHAPALRPRRRVGRAARDPPHGHADRLRRLGHQPVHHVRVARRADRAQHAPARPRPRGRPSA